MMRILYLGDSQGDVAGLLGAEEDPVSVCATGRPERALEQLRKRSYDWVIVDGAAVESGASTLFERFEAIDEGVRIAYRGPIEDVSDDARAYVTTTLPADAELDPTSLDRNSDQVTSLDRDSDQVTSSDRDSDQVTPRKERPADAVFDTDNPFVNTVLDRIGDVFVVTDLDGNVVYWNDRVNEITGYTDREIDTMRVTSFLPEEESQRVFDECSRSRDHGGRTVELPLVTKDGTTIEYEFSGLRIRGEDDTAYVVAIGRDVSRRAEVEAELQETVRKLERSNDDLEKFAYVASHDLKEPLRTIRTYLDLFERRHADELDEGARELVEVAIDGADRMQRMIDRLLAYSRVGTDMTVERVDCDDVLQETFSNIEGKLLESNARIAAKSLPAVEADRDMLVQLFQNLLSNALEHADADPLRVFVFANRRDEQWEFGVQDNGDGIPEARREGIFEPFVSGTDDTTGIGLALCEKIVSRHDGDIRVESEQGECTTFYFTLPAADNAGA